MAQQEDFQPAAAAEAPIPCVNNCGYFGNRATMNLCSKCYRDSAKMEASAARMVEISQISPGQWQDTAKIHVSPLSEAAAPTPSRGSPPLESSCPAEKGSFPAADSKRCSACRRKFGLMGFKCRCGRVFCSPHRYPSEHGCDYDFQLQGRLSIAKANPVVVASKINKI